MKQRRFLFVALLAIFAVQLWAKEEGAVRRLKTWRLTDELGLTDSIQPDTLYIDYTSNNAVDRNSIANAYNGNLVSPIQSKIYFDRYVETDFLFSTAYNPYILTSEDITYFNTTTAFSNITYRTGGTNYREEDHIHFIFSANANKNTNFGVNLDYLYPRGEYAQQSAKRFAGSLFGSYTGSRYKAYGNVIYNKLANFENGGIVNPEDLTSPIATKDIPVRLNPRSTAANDNVMSAYNYISGFYHHKYSLGVDREVKVSEDSVAQVFVPVTTFAHTLKIDEAQKRYAEKAVVNDTTFYQNTYNTENSYTNDTAAVLNIKNTLSVTFEEEFNKWLKFGATVYAENEVQRFVSESALSDTLTQVEWKSNTKVGGVLSKRQGKFLKYAFGGDVYLLGYKLGDFNVHGNLEANFRLGKDNLSVIANAYLKNEEPSYFLQNYRSNHFRWSNDFNKTYRFFVGGEVSYPNQYVDARVKVGFENLTNYIYFGSDGLPAQHAGNIQVLSGELNLKLAVGCFALDNTVIYQMSSSQYLPLPTLSLYHNLYYHDCWFKVLYPQIGVNLRMHTDYYAPVLNPATGQFGMQNHTKVGNYPVMNVYANFFLKQVRFFVEYTHFNQLFMDANYFSMPGYPVNPALLKFGLSWSFYK